MWADLCSLCFDSPGFVSTHTLVSIRRWMRFATVEERERVVLCACRAALRQSSSRSISLELCVISTFSRVWINRVSLLLVVLVVS